MSCPTIAIYSDIHCPWAYMATYRLRKVWPEYAERVRVVWRALALEFRNERATPKPTLDAEIDLLRRVEPELPMAHWRRPEWQWPVTFWPAFELLACAQAQSHEAAFALSWALRQAFFAQDRNPSLRHELLAIAKEAASETELDLAQLEDDWDHGRYKASVLADSRRGWYELQVNGSPTFVLPDGRQVSNPGAGEADIDSERGVIRSYIPFDGDPLAVFRELLETAASHATTSH